MDDDCHPFTLEKQSGKAGRFMKIERVDDKTVKCFLSNEELEEHDIDYKDFLLRNDKAKEIVQEIMLRAQQEVDYTPPKYAFDLQIMMLPDQGLLLTFSEKDPLENATAEQIMQFLKEMKNILLKTKEQAGLPSPGTGGSGNTGSTPASPSGQEAASQARQPDFAVFSFASLRSVMEYASALPSNLRINSKLYAMDDIYLLYLQKGAASYARYSRACVQALEFAGLYCADEERVLFLEEHAECLIAEKAVKKLRI